MNKIKDEIGDDLLFYEDKPKEECGVFGIFSKSNICISEIMYYGLCALQHRGQESSGIAVYDEQGFTCYKSMGLVPDLYDKYNLSYIRGRAAIGHVRYSTTGDSNIVNAQPILDIFDDNKIAVSHNGNLINTNIIKSYLKKIDISCETTTDSELILKLIINQLNKKVKMNHLQSMLRNKGYHGYCSINEEDSKDIYDAVASAINHIKGAYSFIVLTKEELIGVRDPSGVRPLCIGKLNDSYIICSESCALSSIGASFIRDVDPGEVVIVNSSGIKSMKFSKRIRKKTCAFEYIYFSREDSIIDGISVYKSRIYAGMKLYYQNPTFSDVIIGVPESGIAAALGYSKASGIPYEIGFIKNKYLGRTFIQPDRNLREKMISAKLTVLSEVVKDKRVVVVDDSIVRGTTIMKIIKCLRDRGAKEVHLRIASPPNRYCCHLGIDTGRKKELIASDKTEEQLKCIINVDSLNYLSIQNLLYSLGNTEDFCLGCFNGQYPEGCKS